MFGAILNLGFKDTHGTEKDFQEEARSLDEALEQIARVELPDDQRDLAYLQIRMSNLANRIPDRLRDKVNALALEVFGGKQVEDFWEYADSVMQSLFPSAMALENRDRIFRFLEILNKLLLEHPEHIQKYIVFISTDFISFEELLHDHLEVLAKMDHDERNAFFNLLKEAEEGVGEDSNEMRAPSPRLVLLLKNLDPVKRRECLMKAQTYDELVEQALDFHKSPEEILSAIRIFEEPYPYIENPLFKDEVAEKWVNAITEGWDDLKKQFTDVQLRGLVVTAYPKSCVGGMDSLIECALKELEERGYRKNNDFWDVVRTYTRGASDESLDLSEALFAKISELEAFFDYESMRNFAQAPCGTTPHVHEFLKIANRIINAQSPYLNALIAKRLLNGSSALERFLSLSKEDQEAVMQFLNEHLPQCYASQFDTLIVRWPLLQRVRAGAEQQQIENVKTLCASWSTIHLDDLEWLWEADEKPFAFVFDNWHASETTSSSNYRFLVQFFHLMPESTWSTFARLLRKYEIGKDPRFHFKLFERPQMLCLIRDLEEFLLQSGEEKIEIDTFLHLCRCTKEKLDLILQIRNMNAFLKSIPFLSFIPNLSQARESTLRKVIDGEIKIQSSLDLLNLKNQLV